IHLGPQNCDESAAGQGEELAGKALEELSRRGVVAGLQPGQELGEGILHGAPDGRAPGVACPPLFYGPPSPAPKFLADFAGRAAFILCGPGSMRMRWFGKMPAPEPAAPFGLPDPSPCQATVRGGSAPRSPDVFKPRGGRRSLGFPGSRHLRLEVFPYP